MQYDEYRKDGLTSSMVFLHDSLTVSYSFLGFFPQLLGTRQSVNGLQIKHVILIPEHPFIQGLLENVWNNKLETERPFSVGHSKLGHRYSSHYQGSDSLPRSPFIFTIFPHFFNNQNDFDIPVSQDSIPPTFL